MILTNRTVLNRLGVLRYDKPKRPRCRCEMLHYKAVQTIRPRSSQFLHGP
jgi:hypothetical protein